jgi:hypothetical protein
MAAMPVTVAAQGPLGNELSSRGEAWREFRRHRSPWCIAAAITAALTLRVIAGDLGVYDVAAVAGMLAIYPFSEWAIHVYFLHLRPFTVAGRRVEVPTARSHRKHHERPADLDMILLGPLEAIGLIFVIVPIVVGVGFSAARLIGTDVPLGAALTAMLAGYVLVGIYEWTHFLIHTAYRPRSRYYRSVWRSHRLHHFKNEHYWHGITTTVGDRVLGTFPDHRDVPRSPTARTLSGPPPAPPSP